MAMMVPTIFLGPLNGRPVKPLGGSASMLSKINERVFKLPVTWNVKADSLPMTAIADQLHGNDNAQEARIVVNGIGACRT